MDEAYIEVLRGHVNGPVPKVESYSRYTELRVRYLKNIGLLDCYFDYASMSEMIYTTEMGRRYISLFEDEQKAKDLCDIIRSGDTREGKRYEDAVRKAASILPYRGLRCPSSGYPTLWMPCRSSGWIRPRGCSICRTASGPCRKAGASSDGPSETSRRR